MSLQDSQSRTLAEEHSTYLRSLYVTHERTVILLLFVQWFACIAIAVWTSPFTFTESGTQIHLHVWMALFLGASLAVFPSSMAFAQSGKPGARFALAIAQVLFSSLFIHLMNGRIEAHFHVFGSLALLSFFRDWRVIVAASAIVLIDHGVRGLLWPEMIYGTGVRSLSRSLEHGVWVVFIDVFLILSCIRSQYEMLEITKKNAELQRAKEQLDHRVYERTRDLQIQKEEVDRLALVAKSTTNAVMILDVDYRVVWVNEGWTRIYGHSAEEALGTAIAQWLDLSQWKDTRYPSKQEYGTLSKGIRFEAHLVSPEGDRTLDTEFQPLWSEPGTLTGFIVIQNDVTEKVNLRDRVTSVFAAIAEGILVQDANGRIVDCNPQAQRIFGIRSPSVGVESTITCDTIFEDGSNWPLQDHPGMVTLRSGIPIHDAIMGVRDPAGLLRWISVNTQLIRSKASESHVVSSFTDITLRREQLERMDLTIRGAGLGVWDWNAVTDHVRFNHLFARMLGYGPEQLKPTRQQWLDLMHPEDMLESLRLLELHLKGERPDYRCEYRMKHASGEWHWVLAAGRVMERGTEQQPLRIAGVHVDINKSKKLETKLRENEARMRQIFDLALDGVVATDKQGQIRDWNLQAERIFGYSRSEAIGKRLDLLLGLEFEQADSWLEAMSHPKREAVEGRRFQSTAMARGGRRLNIEIALSAIHLDEQLAYSVFIRDISQSKMLEQQLMQSQRLESIGQLAAGVAHEINTPVQFVNDSVHFLKDGVHDLFAMIDQITQSIESIEDGSTRQALMKSVNKARTSNDLEYLTENIPEAIDRSLDGLTRVAEIVRSMKEFSHRGSGEMKAHDLTRAILNTLTVAQNEYKYVADVETDFAGIPLVTCNGGEISQVLLNLVVNAAHAIADRVNGSSARGKITISTRADETSVYIDVSDTGRGVPKRIQHRIFEPFFTTKEVGRGSGQGLAIAHSVIKNHRGELSFSTKLDVGTTFHIRLPIDQRPVAAEGRS